MLPVCLRSIRDFVDELIIVDTGSTDSTVGIAQDFGAQVERFTWCDDFSAARNYALSFVKTPWTLWLDADDQFLNPELLKDICQQAHKSQFNGIWSTYYQDASCHQKRLHVFKTKQYRWEGVVHENPMPRNHNLAAQTLSNFKVRHRKPEARTREAAEKYLKILLDKDPTNYFGIAESYKLLNDKQKAEMYYVKAAFHPMASNEIKYVSLFQAARYCLEMAAEEKSAALLEQGVQMTEIAHKLMPHRAEAVVLAGQLADALGLTEEAQSCYEEAIQMPIPTDDVSIIYQNYYNILPQKLLEELNGRSPSLITA